MNTAQFFQTVVKDQPKAYVALRIDEAFIIPTPEEQPKKSTPKAPEMKLDMPAIVIKEIVIPKKTIHEMLSSPSVRLVGSHDCRPKALPR